MGHLPRAWPRHRWTGFSDSLTDIGVLLAIHQLAHPVYIRFLQIQFGVTSVAAAVAMPAVADAEANPEAEAGDLVAEAAGDAGARGPAGPSWAEANRSYRREALRWLADEPLGAVMVMKVLQAPLEAYMQAQLSSSTAVSSSEEWARALREFETQSLSEFGQRRRFPLLIAANGEQDAQAMASLRELQERRRNWSTLPDSWLTLQRRHEVFRLCSRTGCAVRQCLATKHQGYPYRLWRLFHQDPAEAEAVIADCPKLRDPYAAASSAITPKTCAGAWRSRSCSCWPPT